MTVDLRAALATLDRPVEAAENLPREAYTDPAFLAVELARVFGRGWTCVGAGGEIPDPGDAVPVTLGDLPLLLVRQRDGSIRAFHNVCRHRGPVLVTGPVKRRPALVCPYHGWSYDLAGTLKGTPLYMGAGRQDPGPLDKSCFGLVGIRCEVWNDGIFVNLSDDAPPLAEVYAPLTARWSDYDFSLLRYGGCERLTINGNWKLVMENFQEGYHLPWTHPLLNALSSHDNHYSVVEPTFQGQGSHYYDTVQGGHGNLPNFPRLSDHWRNRAEYPAMLPNLMLGIHPDHLLFFSVLPRGPDKTEEVFHFYFVGDAAMTPEHDAQRAKVISNLVSINAEDIGVVERMQSGRRSPGFIHAPFSPYQERTIHQFQRRIAELALHGEPPT